MLVSVGMMREFSGGPGGSTGAGTAARSTICAGVERWRSIIAVSGSVPVFTDQRSTPQVGLCTVSVMGEDMLRLCTSLTVATMFLTPVAIDAATVAWKEYVLSPVP